MLNLPRISFSSFFRFRVLVLLTCAVTLAALMPHSLERQKITGLDFPIFYKAAVSNGNAEGYVYPPFLAWGLSPLTHLDEPTAAMIWYVLQGVIYLFVIWYCVPEVEWRDLRRIAAAVVFFLASYRLLVLNAELGQVNALVVFLVLVGLRASRGAVAGISLALAAVMKLSPLLFVPYIWLTRRKEKSSFVAAFVTVAIFCALIPLAFGYSLAGLHRLSDLQQNAVANLSLFEFSGPWSYPIGIVLLGISLFLAWKRKERMEVLLFPAILLMLVPAFVRKAHLLWGLLLGPLVVSDRRRLPLVPLIWALGSLGTMILPALAVVGNLVALGVLAYELWEDGRKESAVWLECVHRVHGLRRAVSKSSRQ